MWTTAAGSVLAFMLVAQTVHTAACESRDRTPGPTPTPIPGQPGNVVTTADGVRFQVETVLDGLQVPWEIAFAPDGRLFVTERQGRVHIANLSAGSRVLALTMTDVFTQGEAGLLGMAIDPAFAQNGFVYFYYTASTGGGAGAVNRIVRYREAGGQLAQGAVLLDGIPAASIHDGGRLRFGPDGLLYATAGDANNTALPQNVASLAGKFLRINPSGSTPGGNPFSSPVLSIGHRNPQGFDWHPASGDLWASEHGPTGNDEINVIDNGANYGWPAIQGAQSMAGMRTPLVFFSPSIAPSGASFYRGNRFPPFVNNLFVATLRGEHLLRLTVDAGARTVTAQERLLEGVFGRLRTVVSGPDGYLYIATNNQDGRGSPQTGDDRVLRLVPAP
jgi:glucose/arabinose dehydrogenase